MVAQIVHRICELSKYHRLRVSAQHKATTIPEVARGDRWRERAHLQHSEQRRLQGRLRHQSGGLRRGGRPLFDTLDWLDLRLSDRRFLLGDSITEADIRLFTTLIRFDAVYYGHFKCNIRRITDYPDLSSYTRDIFQTPGVSQTVDFDHIKRHYYASHRSVNPTGIVPVGPALDFDAPHDRQRLGGGTDQTA